MCLHTLDFKFSTDFLSKLEGIKYYFLVHFRSTKYLFFRFKISVFHKSCIEFFQCIYMLKENTAAIQKIFTYYNYSSACVNSVELGTFAATKASLFVVRKFFNMNSMHGTHIFCLQMSSLSVFFRKPLNHFFTECNSLT